MGESFFKKKISSGSQGCFAAQFMSHHWSSDCPFPRVLGVHGPLWWSSTKPPPPPHKHTNNDINIKSIPSTLQ